MAVGSDFNRSLNWAALHLAKYVVILHLWSSGTCDSLRTIVPFDNCDMGGSVTFMRLASESRRRWHYYRARNQRRRESRDEKPLITLFRDGKIFAARGTPSDYAPADLRLFHNHEGVVRFLQDLRYSMKVVTPRRLAIVETKRRNDRYRPLGKPRRIGRYISFDRIEQIDPPGALLLAAEFDRARQRFGARLPAVNVNKWNPGIRQTLEGLGFFKLLEIGGDPPALSLGDQTGQWSVYPFVSDKKVEGGAAGNSIRGLIQSLGIAETALFTDDRLRQMFRSVVDCLDNVFEHAYPERAFIYPHVGRWWLTGAVDGTNRRLMISIYDQGVTIPGNLVEGAEKTNMSARRSLKRLLRNRPSDGELIRYAVENQVTTTGDEQRGRGLGKLRAFVDACQTGEMKVFSRKGIYHYSRGQAALVSEMSCSVGGTLISLQVGL